MKLEEKVRKIVLENNLIVDKDKLVVGVSRRPRLYDFVKYSS